LSVLLYFDHCIVCPSLFRPLYCLSFFISTIVLSVLLYFDHCIVCPFLFQPLYCLSFFISTIVLSVLLYFDHCIVCPSLFRPLYYLSFFVSTIVLSVLLRFTDSDWSFWYLQTCLTLYVRVKQKITTYSVGNPAWDRYTIAAGLNRAMVFKPSLAYIYTFIRDQVLHVQ
jgi:hypothetical protein